VTSKKESAAPRRRTKHLRIRKETIKDLDTRHKGEKVKGGVKDPTLACNR
jgi:hypothetical protein